LVKKAPRFGRDDGVSNKVGAAYEEGFLVAKKTTSLARNDKGLL
jgi:hypothetical protein